MGRHDDDDASEPLLPRDETFPGMDDCFPIPVVPLFLGYDSMENPFRPTLHTSFLESPAPAEDAPRRRNLEVRVLCLLPKHSSSATGASKL